MVFRWFYNKCTPRRVFALYYRTGAYTRADLRIDYEVADGIVLGAGVRNALDQNFALTDGFPEPRRSFYLSARSQF